MRRRPRRSNVFLEPALSRLWFSAPQALSQWQDFQPDNACVAHTDSDLWTCPECGEKFTSANMSHSCGLFSLDALFARCEPKVRDTYDALERLAGEVAPFHVIPQKTRICFQLRTRCAACSPLKSYLRFHFLSRTVFTHP